MRPYEVMVIFDTGAEPPAIQAVVDRLLDTIRGADGTPGAVDRWGRRPFAYEVKHRREGYYVLVELAGTSRTVAEVDRMLTLADEVIRHKVIRIPDKAVRAHASRAGAGPAPDGRPRPERSASAAAAASAAPPAASAEAGRAAG